jgi:hypothetical protein
MAVLSLASCGGGGDADDGGQNPPGGSTVTIGGTVRFARVPFKSQPGQGLDYANPVMQPARGVTVRALLAGTLTVLAAGSTDANGIYSLQVPADTNVAIQVVAQMQRGSPASLPHWDVRVQNGLSTASPYTFISASFGSSTGGLDVDIPSGLSASGAVTDVRASAPFAILDTIYTAIQTVLTVEPQIHMPALLVDWGSQTGGTYFGADGTRQWIALGWNLNEDTDEFDQHVIAHEFGHYLEHNFSRSDSVGGSHGLGDWLDPRLAFSEGFGYAFAAIVSGEQVMRDSFVFNGNHVDAAFNVELNPVGTHACWCSETSVWSMLWDLYDDVDDGADAVSVGFAALWDAMKAHRDTPSVTTIFSFIEALKAARPQDAMAINAVVAAQNIDAEVVDAFATGETHSPYPQVLPLFTDITLHTPVTLRNIDDAGRHNKLGNHRLLRFVAPDTRRVTVSLETSNPDPEADPDFLVFRNGELVAAGEDWRGQEIEFLLVNAGETYVIDAYDCGNGCYPLQGTPGDYDLKVIIY